MSLLGGLLGGGPQPASGSDPAGAIVLDAVKELKLTVVRRPNPPLSNLSSGLFRLVALSLPLF